MHAVFRYYQGVTDTADAGRQVQETFVPIVSKIPGFVSYFWTDLGNNTMSSVTVFETEEGCAESVRQAAAWITDNRKHLLPNPPQVSSGAVVAHGAR
jgi:hypothetical protein